MHVSEADPDDRLAARSILDAAMLEVPDLSALTLLVACEAERVLGAAAVDAEAPGTACEIAAIAVRPRRRGQGIGTALVYEIETRWTPVVAAFDERARPFYASLDFDVERLDDGRYRGEKRSGA